MANLQVRNVPDELYQRLRKHVDENSCTMRAVVLAAIERELIHREWQENLAQRPETHLGIDAATLLAEERVSRDAEVG